MLELFLSGGFLVTCSLVDFDTRWKIANGSDNLSIIEQVILDCHTFLTRITSIDHECSTSATSVAFTSCQNQRCENTVWETLHTYRILIRWMRPVSGTYPRSRTFCHEPFWFPTTFFTHLEGVFFRQISFYGSLDAKRCILVISVE